MLAGMIRTIDPAPAPGRGVSTRRKDAGSPLICTRVLIAARSASGVGSSHCSKMPRRWR
jgi:hypothetical protein